MQIFLKFLPQLFQLLLKFIEQKQSQQAQNPIVQKEPEQNNDLIVVKYIEIFEKEAHGILYFQNLKCAFISGKWGKGPAPKGKYIAQSYRETELNDSFSLFGIGFFIYLIPQFETDRTELGIHFDGGDGSDGKKGFVGTLGCIGLKAASQDEAVRIRNVFRNYFDSHKTIEVQIV